MNPHPPSLKVFVACQAVCYALLLFIKMNWIGFINDVCLVGRGVRGDEAINEYESFLVDLLDLAMAHGVFEQHQLTDNEQVLEVPAIITCLFTIYTELQQVYPDLIDIPLCVDLCLNWLLNVYDRYAWMPQRIFHCDTFTIHKFTKTKLITIMNVLGYVNIQDMMTFFSVRIYSL